MKILLFFITAFSCLVNAQLLLDPLYNLSNTPSATSDYHSVYSNYSDFFAAWGNNGEILFKRSSDFGQTWGPNRNVTSSGSYPVIAAEGNEVVIVYHDLNAGVFSKKSTDGGNTWQLTPYTLSTHSSGITPQLTGAGLNLYAIWEERPASNYELYFSKSTNFGTSWSAPVNISNTTTTSRWVQIKALGNTIYCTWIESTTYPLSDIFFIKSTDAGTSWSAPVNITNDSRPQNRIFMEVTYEDNIYLACDDIPSYPPYNFDEIYLIKSTDGGSTWSSAVNITNNSGNSNTPCIAVVEPVIYFTWADNTESAPAYDNTDIYIKLSPDGGVTWGDSIKVCSNPESSSRPRICWAWNGPIPAPWIELSIIWYDYSTGDSEILARNGKHYVPVELTSFTADVEDADAILRWSTASESNNKGFEVQRQISQSDQWSPVIFIDGKGTTTEPQEYSYSDRNLSRGNYTYRLKQIDFNGSFEYSNEIEANVGSPAEFSLSQNYPNPFNPVTTVWYSIPEPCYVTMNVYDILGNQTAELVNEFLQPGLYQAVFSSAGQPSGIYFLNIKAGNFNDTKKMVMMK